MVPRDGVVNLDRTMGNSWIGRSITEGGAPNEATGIKSDTEFLEHVLYRHRAEAGCDLPSGPAEEEQ
eukprot:10202324-Karenia_brevis.AAC.1